MPKHYSEFNLWIRSAIFWLISITLIFFYSFICLIAWLFPLRYRHALIRTYLHTVMFLLKHLCYIDYQVEGLENIPKDQTGIIMSKHQSAMETFFLPLIFHNIAVIAKRELLWIPFFGWGLATTNPISIDRKNKSSALKQIITKGQKCLDQGRWILVFPEGTRVPPGQMGKFHSGGTRLAIATGYPIMPVAHNAGWCWPKRKFIKRPGTVRVIIGPFIETKGRSVEEVTRLTKEWIEKKMVEIDHPSQ